MAAKNNVKKKVVFSKMKYAIKFRALLETENISASDLAALLGFTRTRVSRIVNGVNYPTVKDIELLKNEFPHIDLNEFIGNGIGLAIKGKSKTK